jgi:GT2 family glycosyltransferase
MSHASASPTLTIIVPTYNRVADARATVDQLLRQPFADFELWLIDQSDPPVAEANARFVEECADERLHYLHLKRKNLPNARNEGLARARGQIVLFVDDDVILLGQDFIGAHVRAFDDPAVGGVTGRHVERSLRMNARRTACYVSWGGRTIFNLFGTERQEIGSCKGSNMSFRMSAVRQIGGFDRRTHLLEETDFSARLRAAGWRLMFEPEPELLHLSTAAGGVRDANALDSECRRFSSTAYYILKHRGWLGVAPFVATFTLIALERAVRLRTAAALPRLYRAMFEGFAEARRGADEALPAAAELQDVWK